MNDREKQLSIGKDSVVIGNVSGTVGDGSVVIGATDNRGNVILNREMAIGRHAHAGPGSIAIGAYASTGPVSLPAVSELITEIDRLKDSLDLSSIKMESLLRELETARGIISKPQPDTSRLKQVLQSVRSICESAVGSSIVLMIDKVIGTM